MPEFNPGGAADLNAAVKARLEANANTNTLTDAEKSAVGNIPADTNSALAGKAASSHSHTIANVTGLQGALDGKATAAQGATADSEVQPADLISGDANNTLSGQVKFWVGSQADYDALGTYDANTIYDVVS